MCDSSFNTPSQAERGKKKLIILKGAGVHEHLSSSYLEETGI